MRLRRVLPALAAVAALVFAGTAAAAPAHAQPPVAVGCDVDYTITIQWSTGFVADVTVTNTGSVDVAWQVEITFVSSEVTNAWNGVFTFGPQSVIIEPALWDPMLTPGQVSIPAGFIALGDGALSGISVTGTSV